MTDDESLEKKLRRAEKLNNVLGVITLVTGFAAGAFLGYIKGDENGYAEGKKAGIAEAQEQHGIPEWDAQGGFSAHFVKTDNKELIYSVGFLQPDGHVYESLTVCTDGCLTYFDGNSETSRHDGLVDRINSSYEAPLFRAKDYEANKALFDEADRLLKETREQFIL